MKTCGAVHVERWESEGKPRERDVRCTLPSGHAGRHGWELDKANTEAPKPVTAKANMLTRSLRAEILEGDTQRAIDTLDSLCDVLAKVLP